MMKKQKGITIIALVVTIIVLMILATISINVMIGDEGIIKRAKETKEKQENELNKYTTSMGELLDEYKEIDERENNWNDSYIDNTLAVPPRMTSGMIKIKYKDGKWYKVEKEGEEWYNYANREWANVVLSADKNVPVEKLFNVDGSLDESKAIVQLVWVPRYAYKITSKYHTACSSSTETGTIDIVFIDGNNKSRTGSKYLAGPSSYPTVSNGAMENFIVHPAFDYGGSHLTGFWMGKFETSSVEGNSNTADGDNVTTKTIQVKGGVQSWRYISNGNTFEVCLGMNKADNPYGLSENDSIVDPHMCKNDEWGAVAYLSNSIYGKYGASTTNREVYINNSGKYITGSCGNAPSVAADVGTIAYGANGYVNASTTGNATGIFDMSGGAWERTAAYIENGHENLEAYGGKLYTERNNSAYKKYLNLYPSTVSNGASAEEADYNLCNPNLRTENTGTWNGKYGDGIWETSGSYTGVNGWYFDYSGFLSTKWTFFVRGGACSDTVISGVFYFYWAIGSASEGSSFRVVVPVL